MSGFGDKSIGDFFLDHQDGAFEEVSLFVEFKQNRSGDLVGQVADDEEFFVGCQFELADVKASGVGFDELDVFVLGEQLCAEDFGEFAIAFDGEQFVGAFGEWKGQGTSPCAKLQYDTLFAGIEDIDDAANGVLFDEKVLAPAFFGLESVCAEELFGIWHDFHRDLSCFRLR